MKKIFAFAASLLLAVGCTAPAFEENINNNENGEYDVLYAAVDNEASKVLIDAANDLSWNAGDQISVWHNTNNKPYAFQGADGDKVGEFKYQLFGGSTTQTTFSQIYALYPYAETSAINEADETISYTIPAEQTYREGTVAAGAAVMTAIAKAGTQVNNNKNALQFKNAMSFLRVQLKGEGTVKSVAITANSGEALAGNVTISHDENNIPAFTVAEEGASSTLTLNCGEGVALDKEETTTFWMAVRPVVLATGMTVTVTTADDVYTFLVENENLTFGRNKINKITREVVRSPYKSDAAFVQSTNVSASGVYTLAASTNNELAATGFKLGTSSKAGVFTSAAIGVEGEKYLNFYGAAWNGGTADLYFRVDGGTAYYQALEGTAGANNNEPYTLTVGEEQHYSIKLSGLTAESVIEFSTANSFTAASKSNARAIIFGVTLTDEALGTEISGVEPELPIIKATVAEFLAAEVSDKQWYELTGTISNIANTTYGNFDLTDENGDKVLVYGLTATQVDSNDKSFASLGLKAGDIVTLIGTRAAHNGSAQVGGPAYYVSHEEGVVELKKATVAEFLAAAEDATIYELTGEITSVTNTTYGNFYLKDATGEVYIYGLCSPTGVQQYWAESGAEIGDTITVQTVRTSFNGTAQGENAIFVSLVKNENPRILSITPSALSFGAEGGDKTVEVETFGESTLNVTENADWLTVSTSANVITVTAEEYTNTENDREATITITYGESTETVTVSQGKKVAEGEASWQLVTDASSLKAGDQIVIAAKDYNFAISTTQNGNNRGQAAITKSGNTISTPGDDVQIITLVAGANADTFGFQVEEAQYLYAASSSKNYLRTSGTLNANASWKVTINADGTANVVAQGSNTRNTMQYNQSSSLFSCYSSASQKAICIYKYTE